MRKKKLSKANIKYLIALVLALFGVGFSNQDIKQAIMQFIPTSTAVKSVDDKNLAQMTFKSGDSAYILVNNNKSRLNPDDWKQNKIEYGNLDNLNRTTEDTGYLSRANLVASNTRSSQRFKPTGWHQKRINENGHQIEILNRGHLLAYSITGNFDQNGNYRKGELGSIDNPKNLATQTEFSNQQTMQIFEEKVRDALRQDKKVIYRVSTVYKDRDLMPIGYHCEAISTDKTLNFNVFVWNVEPGVKFDYKTGYSKIDRTMEVHSVS